MGKPKRSPRKVQRTGSAEVPSEGRGILLASKADRRVSGTIFVIPYPLTVFVSLSLLLIVDLPVALVWAKEIGVSELPTASHTRYDKAVASASFESWNTGCAHTHTHTLQRTTNHSIPCTAPCHAPENTAHHTPQNCFTPSRFTCELTPLKGVHARAA